jgi:hypothetical protein
MNARQAYTEAYSALRQAKRGNRKQATKRLLRVDVTARRAARLSLAMANGPTPDEKAARKDTLFLRMKARLRRAKQDAREIEMKSAVIRGLEEWRGKTEVAMEAAGYYHEDDPAETIAKLYEYKRRFLELRAQLVHENIQNNLLLPPDVIAFSKSIVVWMDENHNVMPLTEGAETA